MNTRDTLEQIKVVMDGLAILDRQGMPLWWEGSELRPSEDLVFMLETEDGKDLCNVSYVPDSVYKWKIWNYDIEGVVCFTTMDRAIKYIDQLYRDKEIGEKNGQHTRNTD